MMILKVRTGSFNGFAEGKRHKSVFLFLLFSTGITRSSEIRRITLEHWDELPTFFFRKGLL